MGCIGGCNVLSIDFRRQLILLVLLFEGCFRHWNPEPCSFMSPIPLLPAQSLVPGADYQVRRCSDVASISQGC